MQFDVVTLFPELIQSYVGQGIVGKALGDGRLKLNVWNPRDYSEGVHKAVDDRPFGGGDGMVLLPEVLKKTMLAIKKDQDPSLRTRVIYMSAQGQKLTNEKAKELARDYDKFVLLCGRYGGIDQRIIENYVDEELSIGDYVLAGGELASLVTIETVSRFKPGILGNEKSSANDSFESGLLEFPLYTRPREFEGKLVPEVLLSGDHKKIEKYRRREMIRITAERRPDLILNNKFPQDEINDVFSEFTPSQNLAIALVHYPVYNKAGNVVATNVTNLDLHDIARAGRTYGVSKYYIITPAEEQLAFVSRVLEHWKSARGQKFNSSRHDALTISHTARNLEEAVEDWGKDTLVISTSARAVAGPAQISFEGLRHKMLKHKCLLIFGTGYGLENAMVRRTDFLLESIKGRASDGFRHLSVRSAVSITLDRLFGACY